MKKQCPGKMLRIRYQHGYQVDPNLPFNFYRVEDFYEDCSDYFSIPNGYSLDIITQIINNIPKTIPLVFYNIYGINITDKKQILSTNPDVYELAKYYDDRIQYLFATKTKLNATKEAFHMIYKFPPYTNPSVDLINNITKVVYKNFSQSIIFYITDYDIPNSQVIIHFIISNIKINATHTIYKEGYLIKGYISTNLDIKVFHANNAIAIFYQTGEIVNAAVV